MEITVSVSFYLTNINTFLRLDSHHMASDFHSKNNNRSWLFNSIKSFKIIFFQITKHLFNLLKIFFQFFVFKVDLLVFVKVFHSQNFIKHLILFILITPIIIFLCLINSLVNFTFFNCNLMKFVFRIFLVLFLNLLL